MTEFSELLFTYGTLQQRDVQLETFGRVLDGEPDALPGYKVAYAEVRDPRVAELAGATTIPVVRATGNPLDKVTGLLMKVSEDELDASDEYEVTLYRRTRATLASGRTAWVYVSR